MNLKIMLFFPLVATTSNTRFTKDIFTNDVFYTGYLNAFFMVLACIVLVIIIEKKLVCIW